MKTFEWWFHSNENFEGEYDQPYDMVIFDKNWWLGSDAIPFQFDSTPTIPESGWGLTGNLCTLVWVPSEQVSSGLRQKLPPPKMKYLKRLCSPRLADLSLLGGPAHRGGACTRVCNWKVSVDYPHTQYDYSGLSLTDVSNVVVKVYPLCRV